MFDEASVRREKRVPERWLWRRLSRSGTRDTASIFSRLSEHGGAAYRCRGDIQLTKSTSGSIFARSKDSGRRPKRISRGAAERREREGEEEREMARGEWTRVEARGKNRAERERFGEQRQKRLERISKDVSSREKKRNGLIIMLSTRFIN